MIKWWFFFLFLTVLPLYGLDAKTVTIVITSDQHSWISSTYLYPRRRPTGLLHLKDQIQAIRKEKGEILLLDGGDLLQGSPLANYVKITKAPTENNPFFDLFESLQYDAVVVGNHDLEENPIFEDSYLPRSSTPWLAANAYRKGKNAFLPYVTTDKQGLKIAVLGLTTPGVHLWLSKDTLRGLEVKSLVDETTKWVKLIREKESPDVLIVVIHAGLHSLRDDEATKSQGIPAANEVHQAIAENQDIDFVITGHSHRLLPYKTGKPISYIGRVPVVAAGHHGKAMLVATMEHTFGKVKMLSITVEKPTGSKKQYKPKKAFQKWLLEELPWKIITKDKEKVGACLNETLSEAVKAWSPNIDYTLLPKIKIRSLQRRYGYKIQRKIFLEWIKYNNKWLTTKVSERDLELLQKPLPLAGSNRIAYNQNLAIYPVVQSKNRQGILSKQRFKRNISVALSEYHYLGGGGFAGRLFWDERLVEKSSDMILREALWLRLSKVQTLPHACKGVLHRSH